MIATVLLRRFLSMPPLSRREVGLGLLSLLLARCTTRSAMPMSQSTVQHPLDPPPVERRLRILCLHGYHGSARTLQSQMAAFAEGIEPLAGLPRRPLARRRRLRLVARRGRRGRSADRRSWRGRAAPALQGLGTYPRRGHRVIRVAGTVRRHPRLQPGGCARGATRGASRDARPADLGAAPSLRLRRPGERLPEQRP